MMSVKDIGLMYDEEFRRNIKRAKSLLKSLRDKKETELALKWLVRVRKIKSPILEVKKCRNAFLSYLIKILQVSISRNSGYEQQIMCNSQDCPAYTEYYDKARDLQTGKVSENLINVPTVKFHSRWSADYGTYMAVKPIPGRGTLIYMAVSKKPGRQNWSLQNLYKL